MYRGVAEMRRKLGLAVAAGLTLFGISASAIAEKGLGPLYNTKYRSNGIVQTLMSNDQRLALNEESIDTINCGGCDTIWYGPGSIFHVRNVTKKPICVAFEFKPRDRQLDSWGSRGIYYLKSGKTLSKIGGMYVISSGQTGTVDMAYEYSLTALDPLSDKRCPDITWALTP